MGGREEARMLHRHEASVEEGGLREGGLMMGTSEEGMGEAWAAGGRKRAGEGLREDRMEQGSKEMKLQGRYPEYTVYSHSVHNGEPERSRVTI